MVDIYATLFDQEQVMEDYAASLQREADERLAAETERVSKETAEKVSRENALAMYKDNIPVQRIAGYLRKDTKTIEAWLGLGSQD